MLFVKEYVNADNLNTDNKHCNKLKELDNEFQSSLPLDLLSIYRYSFRIFIIKKIPSIKELMNW